MYSNHHRFESPSPARPFRRPWSPDPYDPLPAVSRDQDDYYELPLPNQYRTRVREPSDVSVEAFDLADYVATSGRPAFHAYDSYPPSPESFRPFASIDPPSIVSPSASSARLSASPLSPPPIRRPFSLPTPSYPDRALQSHPYISTRPHAPGYDPYLPGDDLEVDLFHYPVHSDSWYGKVKSPGMFSPSHSPHSLDHAGLSPFDPAFPTHAYEAMSFQDHLVQSPSPTYPYSVMGSSKQDPSRDHFFPWSTDPESGDIVDPGKKEERMRMLEQELGGKQLTEKEEKEAERKALIGTVDEQGELITAGPRKRLAMRWLEVSLAFGVSALSIYIALIIKVPSPAPPQQHTFSTYLLYALSLLTFFGATWVFFISPCRRRRRRANAPFDATQGGMMVLPVQSLPSVDQAKGNNRSNKDKNKKSNSSGGAADMANGVQVNLIVDPTIFSGGPEREEESDESEDEGGASESGPPRSSVSARGQKHKHRHRVRPRRRGILEGLAMEAQWREARKQLRWTMMFDIHGAVTWAVQFVTILKAQRCPVGGFNGWCNAYNVATATSCFLCFSFGISLFFDIKDMFASRTSPRSRT